ncbi:hypothetical protein L1987_27465 [Smallanthus sonchifolius]|uniref:Uncharacterized protein n=1 Tax=Smallanthus sonchifolius TaxID=185202 RepID=A0ACB9ICP2_9ASTR|nr:hypothetical protein L1987_27465 [Smallanthus sonchifolius]
MINDVIVLTNSNEVIREYVFKGLTSVVPTVLPTVLFSTSISVFPTLDLADIEQGGGGEEGGGGSEEGGGGSEEGGRDGGVGGEEGGGGGGSKEGGKKLLATTMPLELGPAYDGNYGIMNSGNNQNDFEFWNNMLVGPEQHSFNDSGFNGDLFAQTSIPKFPIKENEYSS